MVIAIYKTLNLTQLFNKNHLEQKFLKHLLNHMFNNIFEYEEVIRKQVSPIIPKLSKK